MHHQAVSTPEFNGVHYQGPELPPVFCWTKMGSEAGQSLEDIIRRKELERQCGDGVFAWGIGNSVGPAIRYAKSAERVPELETLFTPMKAAPKAADVNPSSILLWLGYHARDGRIEYLPDHMMITSRGHSRLGEEKRGHYALICQSHQSLLEQAGGWAIDPKAARNVVSANPGGASQGTSVVRYSSVEEHQAAYPVLFRAILTDTAFVRLAIAVALADELFEAYRAVCASRTRMQWEENLQQLRRGAVARIDERAQIRLL
jgi:hypothetical protein